MPRTGHPVAIRVRCVGGLVKTGQQNGIGHERLVSGEVRTLLVAGRLNRLVDVPHDVPSRVVEVQVLEPLFPVVWLHPNHVVDVGISPHLGEGGPRDRGRRHVDPVDTLVERGLLSWHVPREVAPGFEEVVDVLAAGDQPNHAVLEVLCFRVGFPLLCGVLGIGCVFCSVLVLFPEALPVHGVLLEGV